MRTKLQSLAAIATALAGQSAWAAKDGYKAPDLHWSVPGASVIMVVLFVVAVCLVAFKRSGRTHLD